MAIDRALRQDTREAKTNSQGSTSRFCKLCMHSFGLRKMCRQKPFDWGGFVEVKEMTIRGVSPKK